MRLLEAFLICLGAPLAASAARGQSPVPLLLEGESVPGVGLLTRVTSVVVTEGGHWCVVADTDFPITNQDGVLYVDGALRSREGQPLLAPAGTQITFFVDASLTPAGRPLVSQFFTGTGSFADDSGLYLGDRLLLQEGAATPGPSWVPGTIWGYFSEVDAIREDRLVVRGYVDDPLVALALDDFLALIDLDAAGNVLAARSIAREGDVLPGETYPIGSIRLGREALGFDSSSRLLFSVDLDTGVTLDVGDGQVWLWDGAALTRVAREGDPSPVAGRSWGPLTSPGLSLSVSGDWTIRERLDDSDPTSDEVIVKSGAKLVQEGDVLPGLHGYALTGFGQGRAQLDRAGHALWYGEWNDPDASRNSGLFLDQRLIVQEGVTRIGGSLVTRLESGPDTCSFSPDGRFVAFVARLRSGERGAFLLDLEDPLRPVCDGGSYGSACPCGNAGAPGAGCADGPGRQGAFLSGAGVPSLSADTLRLTVTGLRRAPPLVLLQGSLAANGGLGLPFGDGLLCVDGAVRVLGGGFARQGAAGFGQGHGAALSQLGGLSAPASVVYQVLYRSPGAACSPQALNTSNALEVVWAP